MKYNFDEKIDRRGSNCVKWDLMAKTFGPDIPQDSLPLWIADMDFATPEVVRKAIVQRLEHPVLGYSYPGEEFFQTCVEWIGRRYHWPIQKEWLSFCPGIVPALNMGVLCFSEVGDKVISLTPVYGPFKAAAESHGRIFVECPLSLDEDLHASIDFAKLESLIDAKTKILMLCSPHNPCGRVWREEELRKLGELAVAHDLFIICDEIHADFVYSGHEHKALGSLDERFRERILCCYAPSKTFNMAGLSASVIVIPDPQAKKRFDELKTRMRYSGNLFAYPAMQAAWSQADDWLAELLRYLEGNRDYLYEELEQDKYLVRPNKPEGTYLMWLDCQPLKEAYKLSDDSEISKLLVQKAGLALNQGSSYGPQGQGFMRLNFACPRAVLEEAVKRLADLS